MTKSKYQAIRDKKITNSYCVAYPMLTIIAVLRSNNESLLWDKFKAAWTRDDWKEFFKIKIDHYDNQ